MRGLWLENRILSFCNDLPVPEPVPGEALIRLRTAGICATDLLMVQGYHPFTGIPGHEFVGEVVSVRPGRGQNHDSEDWEGKRVTGEINIVCGECLSCKAGNMNHCLRRSAIGITGHHGVFAEYLTLPVENLHAVPDSVEDEAAVFTEPLAASLEIQEQIQSLPSLRVLLIGAGRLGQLIARTLALTGCDLSVVARYPSQQQLLLGLNLQIIDSEKIVEKGYDLVIEATGGEGGFRLARRAVRSRGTILLKSTYVGEVSIDLSALVVDEITLIGSRCGPFPLATSLLENRQVQPESMIDSTFPLMQGLAAFERARQPGVLKVLLTP